MKGVFKIAEPTTLSPLAEEFNKAYEEAKKGPRYFIDDGCAYFQPSRHGWLRAWITISLYIDGDAENGYNFEFDWHCKCPHPDHWLSYLEEMSGSKAVLTWDNLGYGYTMTDEDIQRFLIEHGIAPGQRFMCEILFNSTRDYWGEYDEYTEGRVMAVEPWTTTQTIEAWEEYFKLVGGMCDL